MTNKKYRLIIYVVSVLAYTALILFGSMYIMKNKPVHVPVDLYEAYYDENIEYYINGDHFPNSKVLFGSENIAKKYAKILYLENYGDWDNELELWVKHYKKYGVWIALLRSDEPILDGPPLIIFKDTDGQVLWYGR